MITIRTNISEVMAKKVAQLQGLTSDEGISDMMRTIAVSMLPVVHDRIHVDGKDASGGQIGTYSAGYMKLRTQGYDSDTITRGPAKGTPRTIKRYNRSGDTKVIVSLTRQLENDFSVVAATPRSYGLGFKNPINFDKARYVEQTYRKQIYGLTPDERTLTLEIANQYVADALSR